MPILYGIIDNLSVADGDSSIVKSFKGTVVKSIKQRWSLDDISPILGLTTVLDACFKQLKFLSDTQKSNIMYALQLNIERLVDPNCTMVSDSEAESNCLINDQSEASVPTDSQDGDIPACKKLKNLL